MDDLSKNLLGVTVGLGSASLVVKSAKMLDKSMKSKVTTKDFIKNSTDTMIGASLLKATSSLI